MQEINEATDQAAIEGLIATALQVEDISETIAATQQVMDFDDDTDFDQEASFDIFAWLGDRGMQLKQSTESEVYKEEDPPV